METRRITRGIWITVLILLLVQSAIFIGVTLIYGVDPNLSRWYVVAMPLFHIFTGVLLTSLKKLFYNVDTGERLTRINFANLLSLIRVSSSPTLLWLVLIARYHDVGPIVVPLTAIVFLTDLLDGQISRRTRQVTQIGRFLDSSSDYTVLFVVAVALVSYNLISMWLFVVAIARFGLQLLGQMVLFVMQRGKLHFRTSFLGKLSVFVFMTVFALSLVQMVQNLPNWYEPLFAAAEYVAGALAVISLVEKAYLFAVDARNALRSGDRSLS
ncbi:MAG: CDP-alcohol phosphatidyltransferase family protein [Spirochaetota bacterium]